MLKYIFISTLLFTSASFSQNVSGNVKDFHFNNPLEIVSVTVKDNSNGDILGTDSTDASGNYSIDYIIVGVNENNSVPTNYYLSNPYPQPFNPSARIDFNTPVQGRFTVRIFNVIGQLVYSKDFTIDAGNHSFDISGLGSAGVYLFNLSSDDFTSTQKLLQLDGGNATTNVSLAASNSLQLSKLAIDELLIEFRKDGYIDKDTVITWQMNLTVDAEIMQIPQPGVADYSGHITTNPGGSDGADLDVVITNIQNNGILAQVLSNEFGSWDASVPFLFRTNGTDTLYNLAGVRITISGELIDTASAVVQPFQQNYFWEATANLITQSITASYNIHVTNLQTGENVPNANVNVKDQNQNLLFNVVTDISGNANKNYQVNYYTNGIDTLWDVTQLNSTITKAGYNELQFSNAFQQMIDLEKELDKIPFIVNFTLNPWNILGFQVTDPVMKTISQDSTRTHIVQADGKLHFNYSLYNDVVIKDIQLIHQNDNYNPYLTVRRVNQKPYELNLLENDIADSLPSSFDNLPDTLIINLDALNQENNANIFLEPLYLTHWYYGNVSTLSDTIRSWFHCPYPGKAGTTRWSTMGGDSVVRIFNWTFEELSGNPVPPAQIADVEAILDTILSKTVHPCGDTLMHYVRFQIDSLTDPNWLEIYDNPINYFYTRHRNQQAANGALVDASTGFMKFGQASYAVGAGWGLKADETLSGLIAVDDNVHGSSAGVGFDANRSLNEVGLYFIYKNWISNPKRRHK